ncbi:MAG: XDD3 family exosortase-dependent surface protein [Cyanobacteria bacterium P01_D01_bin.56]
MKQVPLLISSTLCSLAIAAHTAHAGAFHQGWTYSIDAFDDGAGGEGYEINGLATKETPDHIYISVSGESTLTGVNSPEAEDGNVGWGDILFNFTDETINAANGSLFGIRFSDTNDSGAPQVGVFGNVTAQSVAESNAGYGSLQQYYQDGWEHPNTMGDIATVQSAYGYMGETEPALTSIATGTFLGEIDLLSNQEAIAAGLDFEQFNAADDEIHTMRFDRNLLPGGDFIATLLMECANDGIALLSRFTSQNEPQDVPEPSSMLGLLAMGLWVYRVRCDRESTTETHRSNRPGPDESL